MDISLAGRAAIVTGGSEGHRLCHRHPLRGLRRGRGDRGARAGGDGCRRSSRLTRPRRGRVVGIQGDVAVAGDVRRAYDEAMKTLGKIDIVVNNAGTSATSSFEKLTDEFLQHDLDQKLFAAVRLIRLVWPQMKERRWGRIINVLNIGAKAPRGGSAPTSITRAAGMALTKVLSHEGAPHNILVNALLVGFIEADQHVQAAKKAGIELKDYVAARAEEIPLGRIGRAEEFANMACFLASDAGSYIAGTAINIDGGRSPVV